MSTRPTQFSLLACSLLVLLRISIGWQFLYEGKWKLNTQGTAKPWTAEGYLANAKGPFRDYFRGMVDDPDGFKKLDYEASMARLDDWRDRFTAFYGLTEDQQSKLKLLIDGPTEFRASLAALPKSIDLKKFKPVGRYNPKDKDIKLAVTYDAKAKQLVANFHLVNDEKEQLLEMAGPAPGEETTPSTENSEDGAPKTAKGLSPAQYKAWSRAVDKLYEESGKLALRERLQVWLKEDSGRLGQVEESTGRVDKVGEVDVYKNMLARYNAEAANAHRGYPFEHQDKRWSKVMEKKAELIGPIDGAIKEFETKATQLLEVEQVKKGPLPPPSTELRRVDLMTMWSLAIIGILLMIGLFTRPAAIAAAGLMVLFYLPMPPWPGVPDPPGTEHSLFINKNLIEAFALLAIASLPTGQWFGVDALVRRFLNRKPKPAA